MLRLFKNSRLALYIIIPQVHAGLINKLNSLILAELNLI